MTDFGSSILHNIDQGVFNTVKGINNVLRNITKTSGGFKWKFN